MDTPVTVVARTAAVLRAVAAGEPRGSNTATVARSARLPRATTHRLLVALLDEGFLEREPTSGAWLLGPDLHFLGVAAGARYDAALIAQPIVRRLAVATGESAFFSTRRGDETVCLLREDGSFPLRSHVLNEGTRFPLGVASAGLAILAFLPDEEAERYLSRHLLSDRFGAAHAPHEVRARLAQTRVRGFALNPGLVVEGSWGMGAAVFDAAEQPAWALSLTGVQHRFEAERQTELGRLLLRAAHELGRRLAAPH